MLKTVLSSILSVLFILAALPCSCAAAESLQSKEQSTSKHSCCPEMDKAPAKEQSKSDNCCDLVCNLDKELKLSDAELAAPKHESRLSVLNFAAGMLYELKRLTLESPPPTAKERLYKFASSTQSSITLQRWLT